MTLAPLQASDDGSRYRRASWPVGRYVFGTPTGLMLRHEKPVTVKLVMKSSGTMVLVDYYRPTDDDWMAEDWEPT